MTWLGFPVAIAVALLVVPAGVRGLLDAGLVRTNYRGANLAFPLGAVLATAALVALAPLAFLNDRADLDLLSPELRQWMPYLLGVVFLGFLDDALGRGEDAGAPRAGAVTRGRCGPAAFDRCGQGARGGGVGGLRRLRARARSWRYLLDVIVLVLAPHLFNLLDLRPGRAEKGLALGAGLCLGAWTFAPLAHSASSPARRWSVPLHPARAGDARRQRREPDRRDRRGLLLTALGAAARLIALAVVAI